MHRSHRESWARELDLRGRRRSDDVEDDVEAGDDEVVLAVLLDVHLGHGGAPVGGKLALCRMILLKCHQDRTQKRSEFSSLYLSSDTHRMD